MELLSRGTLNVKIIESQIPQKVFWRKTTTGPKQDIQYRLRSPCKLDI
jgi:hypothetical protein